MRIKKIFLMLMLMCCMASQVMAASASTVRNDIAFLENNDNDIFAGVTNVVEDVGASAVRLVKTVGISVMVLAVLGASIGLMISGKATDKSDKKARIAILVIAGIFFFGGTAIVIWAGDIGSTIVDSAMGDIGSTIVDGAMSSVTPAPLPTLTPTP